MTTSLSVTCYTILWAIAICWAGAIGLALILTGHDGTLGIEIILGFLGLSTLFNGLLRMKSKKS